jgi:glycosyltransferase involved in cell wall biosynthesis
MRIGVPAELLELAPVGGHGKVWHRVLAELRRTERVIALPTRRRRGVDVVLASGHDDLPATGGAPLVVQVHEAGWFTPALRDTLDPGFLAHIVPRTERAVKTADAVITPSHAAARDIVAAYGLPPERVHAVDHGVDPGFVPGLTGGAQLAGCEHYVLYAATLHPRKNLAVLRAALDQLADEGLPYLLVVAGHPAPDREDSGPLEAALAGDRVVRIAETTDAQLAALMAGADAVCLPSLYEGFGLTALEALACAAPLVVSDRGALPEVVGDAAVVVEPTVAGVADGLRRVLGDAELVARLRAAGPRRARGFSWERTAAGWLAVLRGVAARAQRST